MRIVSLLPSATEILCALGLEDRLVGVSHECDFPPWVRRLPKVTRSLIPGDAPGAEIDRLVRERLQTARTLYTLDLPLLAELRPDLLVTQALCDVCAVAEEEVRAAAGALPGCPRVLNLEPMRLADVLASIHRVARTTGVVRRGEEVVASLRARIEAIAGRSGPAMSLPRVALLEWLDPPFCCGHWSPELVRLAGGIEGLGRAGEPSRRLGWAEVARWQPEVVVIACCGWSMERALAEVPQLAPLPEWQDLPAVYGGRVYVVDGSQYFSRPGPRLVDSLEILAHALHPGLHARSPGLPEAVRIAVGARQAQPG